MNDSRRVENVRIGGLLQKTLSASSLYWLALIARDLEKGIAFTQSSDLAVLLIEDLLITAGLITPAADQMVKTDLTAMAIQQPRFSTASSQSMELIFYGRSCVGCRGIGDGVAEFYVSGKT